MTQGLITLGFRGEALASLAEAACLEITSKARGAFETHTKLLQGGRVLKEGLALEQRIKQGTRVTVRDLFFNKPVRRKHLIGAGIKKEVDDCREHILRLALPRSNVGFTFVDSMRHDVLLCLKRGRTERDVLPLVFGQRLVQCGACHDGPIKAELYICNPLEGFASKARQYMYVNGRYVSGDAASKLLNDLFQQLLQDLNRRGCEQQGRLRRFPAFICHISCPPGLPDVTARPDKTAVQFTDWTPVLSAVRGAAMQAWHEFAPLWLLTPRPASAPAQPSATQPRESLAAVGSQGGASCAAAEGMSAVQRAKAASCGAAVAAGGRDRAEHRAAKRVRFSLDAEIDTARMGMESAPGGPLRTQEGPAEPAHGSAWMRSGSLQDASEAAWLDVSQGDASRAAIPALSWLHSSDWDGQPTHCWSENAAEEAQQAEVGVSDPEGASMAGVRGSFEGPDSGIGPSGFPQSPSTAAFAAQLPHSPTLPSPARYSPEDFIASPSAPAGSTERQWQPQLGFRVQRRPCGPSLAPEGRRNVAGCSMTDQIQSPSSSAGLNGEPLWPADAQMASASGQSMDSALAEWMERDDEECETLAAALCRADEAAQLPAGHSEGPSLSNQQQQQQKQLGRAERSAEADIADLLEGCVANRRPPAGRQRASSAPPHHRSRMRAAHTNPLASLCSSGRGLTSLHDPPANHAACGQPGISMEECQAKEGSGRRQSASTVPAKRRGKRGSQTVSGVCSRPGLAMAPKRQQRHPDAGSEPLSEANLTHNSAPEGGRAEEAGRNSCASGGSGASAAVQGGTLADLLREWVNPACASSQRQVPDLAGLACGNLLGLVPASITKKALAAARPLRQVDRKFIPLVCGSQLAIMDQHAADERVQLEHLQDQVVGAGGVPVATHSCTLSPPQPLDISAAEQHTLDRFNDILEAWGWHWDIPGACTIESAAAHGGARLTHAAVVLGTPLNGVELQTFLHQLESTGGSAKVPPGVLRVLASKACHSAIRFGDVLDIDQCERLLENLKSTRAWHCCAHGRPTVAPLVDVTALHRVIALRGCAS
ncbi:hypothetical protein COCSUDRAFT_40245 [Coccomyxa subellipsoidea C-169]|uniref:MutL C-terminal dimerisation domain-containing protein n=1 Tax=Coccomyxa subellipsoidea (strain C-169) TaxID=574566 RepID=I0Z614_COCSC|nr:hypothetical protein COCSUDRAFT_40245 [Coccomyxa subellipsoidea C-169]EIE26083.1 hypothetical protein COCSUDRAFT_40245 [Coccomyxa subellipsoidea C-169]|eukprot:XP_005650627.1 hypothetical protein COCSUDRAFT_40245 [Coccomyxa subellipsoidea C-169]